MLQEPVNKIFFHIDVNSAFLSWTAADLLRKGETTDIRSIPAVICDTSNMRHAIVLAKSIPAGRLGIKTAEPISMAERKCPGLVIKPPSFELYRANSKKLMEHLSSFCPDIQQVSIDECYMDYTPIAHLYDSPEAAAQIIKDSVYETFGFTVNIGISDRKVLAKMASDFEKPNKVHTLYRNEIERKMWPLPVGDLFMCGNSAAKTLEKLGIRTIGDLAATDSYILKYNLKSHGMLLHNYANGIDDSVVETISERAKGIGNSTTLINDVTNTEGAAEVLSDLADTVATRLRDAGRLAGSITVEIKYINFKCCSHQKLLDSPTNTTHDLFTESLNLFKALWNGEPVRLLGIRTTKLIDEDEPLQLSIFDYENESSNDKMRKLDTAIDAIRKKYGNDAIKNGNHFS